MTRYFLRLKARNVLGSVELAVTTRNAAIALGAEWSRALGPSWEVEVRDSENQTQWRIAK